MGKLGWNPPRGWRDTKKNFLNGGRAEIGIIEGGGLHWQNVRDRAGVRHRLYATGANGVIAEIKHLNFNRRNKDNAAAELKIYSAQGKSLGGGRFGSLEQAQNGAKWALSGLQGPAGM